MTRKIQAIARIKHPKSGTEKFRSSKPARSSIYIFECNAKTLQECLDKQLFASNAAWPLQVTKGTPCCLYSFDQGVLLALWKASSDGGTILVPNSWGGRFPFQVNVELVTDKVIHLLRQEVADVLANPKTLKFDNKVSGERAAKLLKIIRAKGHDPQQQI